VAQGASKRRAEEATPIIKARRSKNDTKERNERLADALLNHDGSLGGHGGQKDCRHIDTRRWQHFLHQFDPRLDATELTMCQENAIQSRLDPQSLCNDLGEQRAKELMELGITLVHLFPCKAKISQKGINKCRKQFGDRFERAAVLTTKDVATLRQHNCATRPQKHQIIDSVLSKIELKLAEPAASTLTGVDTSVSSESAICGAEAVEPDAKRPRRAASAFVLRAEPVLHGPRAMSPSPIDLRDIANGGHGASTSSSGMESPSAGAGDDSPLTMVADSLCDSEFWSGAPSPPPSQYFNNFCGQHDPSRNNMSPPCSPHLFV